MKVILAILMASIMMAAMIAPAMGGTANTVAAVGNAAPEVTSVVVTDPGSMNPCPDTTAVTVTATVSDANGITDITSVQITAISPETGVTLPITMTTSTTTGTEAEYTGTISLPCCTSADDYTVTVTASDSTATDTGIDTLTVPTSKGLSLNFDTVSFSGAPGDTDVAGTAMFDTFTIDPTVESVGNTAIDISVLADNLEKGIDTINGDKMEAKIDLLAWQPVGTAYTFVTTLGCQSTAVPAFRLDIPSGTPHGSYTGTLTISAV